MLREYNMDAELLANLVFAWNILREVVCFLGIPTCKGKSVACHSNRGNAGADRIGYGLAGCTENAMECVARNDGISLFMGLILFA